MAIWTLIRKWKLKPLDRLENHPPLFSHSSLATVRGSHDRVSPQRFVLVPMAGSVPDFPVVFRSVLSHLFEIERKH